jgi:hypothetical protein
MGVFSEFTNFKHASFATEKYDAGEPKTAATAQTDGPDQYNRVERKQLEQLYITDPQTFNTINIYKQMLLQTGYKIVAENKTNQKQYDDFFKQIGKIGMQVGLEQLLDRIIHDASLYGYAYVEKVFDGNGKFVDLKPIDAKLMDYARDQNNLIIINPQQNPVGFTMKVGYGVKAMGDLPPKGINMDPTQIYLKAERIACFTLFPYGNGFESIGIIEPSFLAVDRKHKIETAVANVVYNNAAYPIYAVVGDTQSKASPKLMEQTLNALKNFSYNRFGVFSHPTQLNTLKVEHSPQADEFLRYLRNESSASSGLATGFTIGSGEAINRSTLNTQKEMLDVRLDSVAWSIAEQFTKKILVPLKEINKYGSYAALIWNEISTEDKYDKSKTLLNAISAGAILPSEAREYILQAFDLKGKEDEYTKMIEEKKEMEKKMLENKSTKKDAPVQEDSEDDDEEEDERDSADSEQ